MVGKLGAELQNAKETIHLIATRQEGIGPRIRCVFLIHHIETWDSVVDVYRRMQEATDFDAIVITIPRRFRGMQTYGDEPFLHRRLQEMGVPHVRFNLDDPKDALSILKAMKPDIVFRQSHWDADIPAAFSSEELSFTRLCYIPYELTPLIELRHLQGDGLDRGYTPFYKNCWRIYCASEFEQDRYHRSGVAISGRIVVSGHPKVDGLPRRGNAAPRWPMRSEGHSRSFRLIWSSHHSVTDDWSNFGLFHEVYEDMLAWARQAQDIQFVFSPHPALFPVLTEPSGRLSAEELQRFRESWDALDNTAMFGGGDYGPLFAASDALLSDGISFLAEYQLFRKPVLFLERPDHAPFSQIGEQARRGFHCIRDVAGARALIENFKAGSQDPLVEQQQAFIDLLQSPGPAAANIVDDIRRGLGRHVLSEMPANDVPPAEREAFAVGATGA